MLLCWCLDTEKWVWWKISTLFRITHKLHPKGNEYGTFIFPSIVRGHQHGYVHESNLHKIDTQPEVQLRVGAFWCLRPRIFGRRHLPIASVHGKCFTIYWRCWCCFYEGKQFVVNIETWTMNQDALWQLKSPETRNTKTACWKNGSRENSKKWRSWTPGWVFILWPNDLNAPWTYS